MLFYNFVYKTLQFSANIDLDQVRAFRHKIASRSVQAAETREFKRIRVDFTLLNAKFSPKFVPTEPIDVFYHLPEEEIALGPACWLYDYLRRSGQGGYFLPLSGGADSAATAAIVGSMCQLLFKDCTKEAHSYEEKYNKIMLLKDLRRICGKDDNWVPSSDKEIANIVFVTCYMGTENSSEQTKGRAKKLAEEIGCHHLDVNIDPIISSFRQVFEKTTNKSPTFEGSNQQNLALQNIQARSRMVLSYFYAQLINWVREMTPSKNLLVLSSANLDESLRGYLTKYDCSSADLNPIGSISKTDIKKFLFYAGNNLGYSTLLDILKAKPTAELTPLETNQTDEEDMGMTYDELSRYGTLRKIHGLGPVGMFQKLAFEWRDRCSVKQVSDKVKHFFRCYAINRHKMTVLTPSYHSQEYNCDDNRFDLRQFLYNVNFSWQFKHMDMLVKRYQEEQNQEDLLDLNKE